MSAVPEDSPRTKTPAGPLSDVVDEEAFRKLLSAKRRFIGVATAAGMGYCTLFVLLASYGGELLSISLYRGVTTGYVLGLLQFAVVWGVTWAYIRHSARVFRPMELAALRSVRTSAEVTQ